MAVATARPNENLDKAKLLKELQQLQKNLERANQECVIHQAWLTYSTGINLEEASRGLREALDEFESQRDQNDMLASVLLVSSISGTVVDGRHCEEDCRRAERNGPCSGTPSRCVRKRPLSTRSADVATQASSLSIISYAF